MRNLEHKFTLGDKLLETEKGNFALLENLFFKNKDEDKIFYYISKAKYGTNPEHWFLTIQQKVNIYVIDPLSSIERDDFFKAFINGGGFPQFNYYRNSQRLQYSSGVCEIYAIKLAFYMARLETFNKANTRFKGFFGEQTDEQKKQNKASGGVIVGHLDPIFENALSEISFGKMVDNAGQISLRARIDNLIEQRTRLLDASIIMTKFNHNTYFNRLFIDDLNLSIRMLKELDDKYSIIRADGTLNRNNLVLMVEKLLNDNIHNSNIDRSKIERMIENENDVDLCSVGYINPYDSKRYNDISKTEFGSITDTINRILFDKEGLFDKSGDRRISELLKVGLIDFYNPHTSIKAGHMYFEALRFKQQLQQQQNITAAGEQEQQQ